MKRHLRFRVDLFVDSPQQLRVTGTNGGGTIQIGDVFVRADRASGGPAAQRRVKLRVDGVGVAGRSVQRLAPGETGELVLSGSGGRQLALGEVLTNEPPAGLSLSLHPN